MYVKVCGCGFNHQEGYSAQEKKHFGHPRLLCIFLEGGFCQDYDRLLHRSSRGHLLCSVRERKMPPRMPLYSSFGIVHVVLVPPPCCTVVETSLVAFDPSTSFTRSVTLQNT